MPTQRDKDRSAVGGLLKAPLDRAAIGALRVIVAEADLFHSKTTDRSIDVDPWHELDTLVNGCDAAARAVARIRMRSAGNAPSTASYDQRG